MRISWKIFCATYLVIFLTVAIVCFVLVENNNTYAWEKAKEEVFAANETAAQLFILFMGNGSIKAEELSEKEKQIADMTLQGMEDSFQICKVIRETAGYDENAFVNRLSENQQGYQVIELHEKKYLQVISVVKQGEKKYYLQHLADLTEIYEQRKNGFEFYRIVVLIASVAGGGILFVISYFIAVPIKKLSKAVNVVAAGDYQKRINVRGCTEVAELSQNFNDMAGTIQKKIGDLNEAVERRERFIADFTHELKTPMTAIIGYADLLRSYELTKEEAADSANTIYREAKRLERLSMQLLEIFVLKKEVPVMQKIQMEIFMQEVSLASRFLSEKFQVKMEFYTEPLMIEAEPSLVFSLLYNLIDNACKASEPEQCIKITANEDGESCIIKVQDFGRGIGREHIKEVMEPFYMEDKSRSRRQGGAGLGLSLCQKIVELHGGLLTIESVVGEGTTIHIVLPKKQDTKEEEE